MAAKSKKRGNPKDHHVSLKVKQARVLADMSQEQLGKALMPPLTFQQIQKYEKGTNRISAGKLHDIAQITQKPIVFFFDGIPSHTETRDNATVELDRLMASSEGVALMRAATGIDKSILRVVASLLETCRSRK